MLPFIIIIVLLLVGAIVYIVKHAPTERKKRKDYLQSLAYFFEGQLSLIPEHENSYRVNFFYRGYECLYEDIELPGLRLGTATYSGHLKIKTPSRVSLTFFERARTQILSNSQTLDDVTNARWGKPEGQVQLPKVLTEFHAYTNNPEWANKFFNDQMVLKIFAAYKNRDSRGHPVMSLQIVEGVVDLEFHAPGDLKPSILVLEHNVTAAEPYLQELILIAEALKRTDSEKSK